MAKKQVIGRNRAESEPSPTHKLSAAELVMLRAADLYLRGEHLTVSGIAEGVKAEKNATAAKKKEGVSRATINNLFNGGGEKPTIKVIEDRIIATVLGDTRAAIFTYLKNLSRLAAENPLDQLIAVFHVVLRELNSPMGLFVAHRLTNLQNTEALTLTFSRVDELLRAAREKGQLNEESGRDLVSLRLMLFGILRGLLMLLPVSPTSDGTEDPARSTRAAKATKGRPQGEAVTAQHVEVEFLRVIQLHVSEDWKEHVEKYIEAARRA